MQAPTAIKEPSLLRKLTAAGAHATLSPARRTAGKENTGAGPSSRHMDRLWEEEEEDREEIVDGGKVGGYDAAVRERELATQKARIVSQMAKGQMDGGAVGKSPRKVTGGLSPAKTLAVGETRRHDGKMDEGKGSSGSLFETVARSLEDALSGPHFTSPREFTQSQRGVVMRLD